MTSFAVKVYKVVLKIPLGQTRTYKWVAKRAGSPGASRAVGQIMKKNPYSLLIPCHRVVASGGKIGGYNRGVKVKKMLLDIEKQIKSCLESSACGIIKKK